MNNHKSARGRHQARDSGTAPRRQRNRQQPRHHGAKEAGSYSRDDSKASGSPAATGSQDEPPHGGSAAKPTTAVTVVSRSKIKALINTALHHSSSDQGSKHSSRAVFAYNLSQIEKFVTALLGPDTSAKSISK